MNRSDFSRSGSRSSGSGEYGRSYESSNRGNYGDYSRGEYNRNDRNSGNDRDWWDKTSDEVSSWFGDEEAERRRKMDKLSGPHRGKGPKGYSRSDDKIRDDINDKLYHDSHVDAGDIDVTVNDGEVTLTGTVDSKDTKRRAEDLAEDVTGVKNVSNNLKVNKNSSSSSWGTSLNESTRTGSKDTGDVSGSYRKS
jgi:osmotically-inducible protein OsmY